MAQIKRTNSLGICYCLICSKERTLVAQPGASRLLTRDGVAELLSRNMKPGNLPFDVSHGSSFLRLYYDVRSYYHH